LLKKTCKYLSALLCILVVIIIVQAAYFLTAGPENTIIGNADLIVVFPAENERIAAGLLLANKGYAPNFTVAGISKENLKFYLKKHQNLPASVKPIISNRSNTTFEDALITRQIIQKHKFKSVILVTSTYHLPRAYFLLRIMISGLNVKIQRYGVDQRKGLRTPLKLNPANSNINVKEKIIGKKAENLEQRAKVLELKLICNEMIKCWTSLGEMAGYTVTGKLLTDSPLCLSIRKFLKTNVLFAVNGVLE
jgi:uncharacterized SAM-binding protein YcdF (DUF218 family)